MKSKEELIYEVGYIGLFLNWITFGLWFKYLGINNKEYEK